MDGGGTAASYDPDAMVQEMFAKKPALPPIYEALLALGFALYSVMQRRFYTQTVLVTESRISLVTRAPAGEAKQEFARHWAKVRLRSPRMRQYPSRLMIESRGRSFEVGSFLTEEERCRLAERLYAMVGGMNESPPLEWE